MQKIKIEKWIVELNHPLQHQGPFQSHHSLCITLVQDETDEVLSFKRPIIKTKSWFNPVHLLKCGSKYAPVPNCWYWQGGLCCLFLSVSIITDGCTYPAFLSSNSRVFNHFQVAVLFPLLPFHKPTSFS